MERLKDKYGNEIESWSLGGKMNDDKMVVRVVLIIAFISGMVSGGFIVADMKPHRAYIQETTKYVVDDYSGRKDVRREDTIKYFLNGKEVTWEEYCGKK